MFVNLPGDRFLCEKPTYVQGFPIGRCRRCSGCLRHKADEWTRRALVEIALAEKTFFVTLTFRSDTLGKGAAPEAAAYAEIQKYLKKVRKHGHSIRYLCSSETGERNGRLHYHLLVHGPGALSGKHLRSKWSGGISHARLVRESVIAGSKATPAAVAQYVAKYATKDGGRVRASSSYGSRNSGDVLDVSHPLLQAVAHAFPGTQIKGINLRPSDCAGRTPRLAGKLLRNKELVAQFEPLPNLPPMRTPAEGNGQ